MRVILVPARIRWICGALILSSLLAGLEAVIVSRTPWWRLPLQTVLVSVGSALAILAPAAWGVARAKWWVRGYVTFVAIAWVALSAFGFIRFQSTGIGFFAIVLGGYWTALYSWMSYELRRSFIDPQSHWYQGLPEPIAGLECRFGASEGEGRCRVGRLDEDGTFVFSSKSLPALRPGTATQLEFAYRGSTLRCMGRPVVALEGQRGYGLQFTKLTADARKTLGDFVELLRGEGHV